MSRWRAPDLTDDERAALDAMDGLDWDEANWRFTQDTIAMQRREAEAVAVSRRVKRPAASPQGVLGLAGPA